MGKKNGKKNRFRPSPPSGSLETNSDNGPSTASPDETLQYKHLDTSIKEFRLLTIHPKDAEADDILVRCCLNHVTSTESPEYDTLSYEHELQINPFQGRVEVDGIPVVVSENLGQALLRLRHHESARIVWIDELCVNQKDLDEKSSQVVLLPSIYKKAEKCVIWLGKHPWEDAASPTAINLVHNSYWTRVWTIPEIALSREREMMFGDDDLVSFDRFTEFLAGVEDMPMCIPLALHSLLRSMLDPDWAGYTQHLLMNSFSDQLCLDPRDHIYAFVGLGNDSLGFPIDYSKSHFEVWKDAIIFRNPSSTAEMDGTLEYGGLIKRLLGATTISEQEISEDITARMIIETEASAIDRLSSDFVLGQLAEGHIKLGSRIAGYVAQVGPACLDIKFSKLWEEWKWFTKMRGPTSGMALGRLGTFQKPYLNHVQQFETHLYWQPSKNLDSGENYHRKLASDISQIYSTAPETVPEEPRIIYVAGFEANEDGPATLGFLGYAPSGTREGDLICQFREPGMLNHRVLVVRKYAVLYQIIGIALLRDLVQLIIEGVDPVNMTETDQLQYGIRTPSSHRYLDVHFDVARAYQLLD